MELFCPNCDYNLRGNVREDEPCVTCPECGLSANVAELRSRLRSKSITPGVVVKRLLIWPVLLLGSSVIPGVSMILMPLTVLLMVPLSGVTAWKLADRVIWTQVLNEPERPGVRARQSQSKIGLFIGFWLAQLVLGACAVFGGCTI